MGGSGKSPRVPGWLALSLQIVVVAAVYVIGARIGLRLAFENRNVTTVWPPTGIAVAGLLMWGLRVWPGVAIGAFVANLTNDAGVTTSAAIMVGNTAAPVIAAALLDSVFSIKSSLDRTRDVFALLVVGGFVGMAISATFGTTALSITGALGESPVVSVWLVWWVGDAIGVVVFAPFLLLLRRAFPPATVPFRPLEGIALLLITGGATYGAFNTRLLLPYIVFVPIVWAAWRFEQVGAASVTVLVAAIADFQTATGRGPLTFLSSTDALISLQAFNATVAFTSLVLATVIRERRRAERVLRSSEELYRKLFERARDVVCIHDADGALTYANAAAERITGYTRERLQNMTLAELVSPDYLPVARRMMHRQLAHPGEPLTYEVAIVGTSGRRVMLEVSTAVVYRGSEPAGVQWIGRDVTSRHLAEERLREHAIHDDLTDLPNETLLREQVRYAVTLGSQDGTSVGVLLIDLDRFRHLNEQYGTDFADTFLRNVASKLAVTIRPTDSLARLHGDEFAIMLSPINGVTDAVAMSALAIATIEEEGRDQDISASVGIAVFPDHARDPETLLRQADVAMHAAKQKGGGVHAVYGPEHDVEAVRRIALQEGLSAALDSGGLELLYQPKIQLDGLRTVGVEAIVRWDHPRYGAVGADELDRVVTYARLGDALTRWALTTAVRRCRVWRDADLDLTIALNVTTSELLRARLVDELRRALEDSAVPADKILIEARESDLTNEAVQAVLVRLTNMGIGVSVDHFGTGYSSLMHLQRLPIREIKIDRTFVSGLVGGAEDRAIARSIIELGHSRGVPVVADGIETRETWTRLLELGCDLAQGPLICEPVPADDLESWLRTPAWSTRVG